MEEEPRLRECCFNELVEISVEDLHVFWRRIFKHGEFKGERELEEHDPFGDGGIGLSKLEADLGDDLLGVGEDELTREFPQKEEHTQ